MAKKEDLQPKVTLVLGEEVVVRGFDDAEVQKVMEVTQAGEPKVVATIGRVQVIETSFTLSPKAQSEPETKAASK